MSPMRLLATTPGKFSLLLDAGTTQVDELVEESGHEPNGYFWEGVARFLVSTEAPTLAARFQYDSEGGTFCAYGDDQKALRDLAELMSAVATDGDRCAGLSLRPRPPVSNSTTDPHTATPHSGASTSTTCRSWAGHPHPGDWPGRL
ncbi:Imm51 family immunity protein [Nonomuraea sp. NPDC050202]|uniref:Imm51 family immunity protein n=1 Tax=Nonomuraea sp. NPDC050202 TaxID=3155035 RepID=UPI003405EE4E